MPLADYYTAQGTPPGFWLGSGIAELGAGHLRPNEVVSEAHLRLLLGEGRDPFTGEALGRAFATYPSRAERVQSRIDALDPSLDDIERGGAVRSANSSPPTAVRCRRDCCRPQRCPCSAGPWPRPPARSPFRPN